MPRLKRRYCSEGNVLALRNERALGIGERLTQVYASRRVRRKRFAGARSAVRRVCNCDEGAAVVGAPRRARWKTAVVTRQGTRA